MEVDARDLKCPLPIVRLSKAIKLMGLGDQVRIQANDPAFDADVRAWCRKTGNALIAFTEEGGITTAVIRKEV